MRAPSDPPPIPTAARERVLGPHGITALALAALMLVLMGVASAILTLRNHDALERAQQTQAVRARVVDVLRALQDAETGQRGFLLTGKDSYLDPFRAAEAALPGDLAAVAAGLPGNSGSRELLPALRDAVAAKMDELRRTVELAGAGRRDEALAVVQTDQGKQYMDAARTLIARIADEQAQALGREIAGIDREGRLLVVVGAGAALLVVLLAAIVAATIRRALRALRTAGADLAHANHTLAELNEGLEDEVRRRTADLTEANEEIQRFAYIVSHDLRSPLVNIMGFTGELDAVGEVLRRHADAAPPEVVAAVRDDLPEAIRFIRTSTAKMDRLIAAILRLSREGRRVLVPERLDLGAMVAAIADSLRQQTVERDATVTAGPLPPLVADRLAMEQVLSNLVENALKYLKPGRPGLVRVEGRTEGATAVIEVRDNGRGIAARDLERVFELFRRAGDQGVPGEGIGLAHVRALLRRLGGTIVCESTPDVGSSFRVRLPAAAGPAGPTLPAGRTPGTAA